MWEQSDVFLEGSHSQTNTGSRAGDSSRLKMIPQINKWLGLGRERIIADIYSEGTITDFFSNWLQNIA